MNLILKEDRYQDIIHKAVMSFCGQRGGGWEKLGLESERDSFPLKIKHSDKFTFSMVLFSFGRTNAHDWSLLGTEAFQTCSRLIVNVEFGK